MSSVQSWLYANLQQWTPFSVLLVLAGAACIGIIVFDIVTGGVIQPAIIAILSILLGSSGTATLFNHGVTVANGVATSTAKAVVQEAKLTSQPLSNVTPDSSKGETP